MNSIKIRYTFRHKGSGNIEMKWCNVYQNPDLLEEAE